MVNAVPASVSQNTRTFACDKLVHFIPHSLTYKRTSTKHAQQIVALLRPPRGKSGSKVKVAMVDGGGGRFAWVCGCLILPLPHRSSLDSIRCCLRLPHRLTIELNPLLLAASLSLPHFTVQQLLNKYTGDGRREGRREGAPARGQPLPPFRYTPSLVPSSFLYASICIEHPVHPSLTTHACIHDMYTGVVKRNDLSSGVGRDEVWMERAALHNLGRDADTLVAAHRRALWRQSQQAQQAGSAQSAAAAWDAALKAHFAQRGVHGGGGRGVAVRALRPVRQREEEEENGSHAGLLAAPHVPGRR